MSFPLLPGTFYMPDPDDPLRPPEDVRVRGVTVTPRPDGKRILVEVDLTPFQKRPYVEIEVYDPEDRVVASLSVVEPVIPKLEFTLHLKEPRFNETYRLVVSVQYLEGLENFRLPEGDEPIRLPAMQEVHRYEHTFVLEASPFDAL